MLLRRPTRSLDSMIKLNIPFSLSKLILEFVQFKKDSLSLLFVIESSLNVIIIQNNHKTQSSFKRNKLKSFQQTLLPFKFHFISIL